MSRAEWLRTFVAVYRVGSVTVGARSRGMSQPAASQQLSALAKAVGGPVLARTPGGVTPTGRGRELYARVAEPLDRLEDVLADLDGGRLQRRGQPVRIGASAELFEAYLLPRLVGVSGSLTGRFHDDSRLIELLLAGELDVAVTSTSPGRRTTLETLLVGHRTFALVGAPGAAPADPLPDVDALRSWLSGRAWITYSGERPVTRQFWRSALDRPFDADVRLTAPDLRAVVTAVELGVGVSLLPTYICVRALASGTLVHLYDVEGLVPPEPWFATVRRADLYDTAVRDVLDALVDPDASDSCGGAQSAPAGARR